MFTAKVPRSRAAAHAREVTAGQNSTSGGARDADVSELTVIPTGSPERLTPVTTATGCGRSRKACRSSSACERAQDGSRAHGASAERPEPLADGGAVIAVGASRTSYSRTVTSFSAGSVNMSRNRSVSRERSASCREANRYTPPNVPEAVSASHHLPSKPGHAVKARGDVHGVCGVGVGRDVEAEGDDADAHGGSLLSGGSDPLTLGTPAPCPSSAGRSIREWSDGWSVRPMRGPPSRS